LSIASQKPIYDSTKRPHPAVEEFLALFQYKDLLFQLTKRNIVTRYKRSVLGIAWTMLSPLGTMIVYSLVFSQIFNRVESYPVYMLSTLIGWQFFSQTTSSCMNSMLWGSSLFKRSYLPKGAFVVSSVLSGMINYALSLVPLFLIMLVTRVPLRISLIAIPLILIILGGFTLGVGLILSAYVTVFPDISEMYHVFLTAWMYLTPIIVPEDTLAKVLNGWVLKLNPMYHVLRLMRMVTYDGIFPTIHQWLMASAVAFITLLLGWYIFTKRADSYGYKI